MATLSEIINSKIAEKGLNLASAAESIGVSAVSLRGVISGASTPNARSIGKYASFAGLSEDDAKNLIKADKAGGSKKKGGKKAKAPKAAKKAKGTKAAKAPKATKAPKAAKAGRKPAGSASSALAAIGKALANAEALAGDKLALAVHGLTAGQRKVVAAIVSSF